ncbi:MAG: AAA family ATPase [Candidatus Aminicenantes bacterium]|nr:AAA family ATPase [Candidatus Aminicenantes bacterium]NIM83698.1 AAA family ATPase [Candidatus Aminicenantes bacterium]NIN23123.1 AAA family ATPase [Candidatus Aminicenantes bacterium]NIN46850.1 AAA family ATPase [Candidatus Aminicenantes bacterium]NIN89772.1 AAA family ATPase [Candidatus Aminicenantes bacterium]
MRRFSSYGPINNKLHYYAPREELINRAYTQLLGENPSEGGHYITVWAPRQTGKTWVMQQVMFRLKKDSRFDVLKINLEHLKYEQNVGRIIEAVAEETGEKLGKTFKGINNQKKFQEIFRKGSLDKPLVLILDEFDALVEEGINTIVSAFRNIYISRVDEIDKTTAEKTYLLHGVSLIGVRSVLGIENVKGSPFNVQRSVKIPNLTYDEVVEMFAWYRKESGQEISRDVLERIYYECNGQPGLTCWLGELLTEQYNEDKTKPITMSEWEYAYMYASKGLPNNNILNIIEKANTEPYKDKVLELFRTDEKIEFRFDDKELNFLYMNGITDIEESREDMTLYNRFSCPFVQKRLFNYLSNEIFDRLGRLVDPFENLDDAITEKSLNIPNLIKRYRKYLQENREWLFKEAPRRKDLKLFEAVYHFNLYRYLYDLLKIWKSAVFAEFPTGNGKVDILIKHAGKLYALELKSFVNERAYKEALKQTAVYGRQLGLSEISLLFFIETIDEENRKKFETEFVDEGEGGRISVKPVFVQVFD